MACCFGVYWLGCVVCGRVCVVRSSLFVVRRALFVAHCLPRVPLLVCGVCLFAFHVFCYLFIACWLWCVVRCSLLDVRLGVVGCSVSVVDRCLLVVGCRFLFGVCCAVCVVRRVPLLFEAC